MKSEKELQKQTTAAIRYFVGHYPNLKEQLKETSVRRFKSNYLIDLKKRVKNHEESSEDTV